MLQLLPQETTWQPQITGGFEPEVCRGASQIVESVLARAHSLEHLPGDATIPHASSRMALGSSDLFGPIPCGQWRLGKAKMGGSWQNKVAPLTLHYWLDWVWRSQSSKLKNYVASTAKDLNSEGQQRLDSRHVKAHYGGSQCHIKSDDRSCRASTSAKCRPIVLSAFMRQALLPVLLSSTK